MKKEILKIMHLECEGLKNPLGIDIAAPRLGWVVESGRRGAAQSAYQVLASSSLEALAAGKGDLWDSGRVSSGENRYIKFGGKRLESRQKCFWKVRVWDESDRVSAWSKPAWFSIGLLKKNDWSAKWIGMPEAAGEMSAPWLRKTFSLSAKPGCATVYVNVMGYCELFINGKKVGDDVLAPHVSDYSKRSFYTTYDVSKLLRKGENCIAAWLGQGWYQRKFSWSAAHAGPVTRIQLEISDGRRVTQTVATDSTWKTRPSNVTLLGKWAYKEFGGERLDACVELKNWNSAALDDSEWHGAVIIKNIKTPAVACLLEPNRILETIIPSSVRQLKSGEWLVDMGRAMTGWFEMKLPPGERGREVVLEFGDAFERNGKSVPFTKVGQGDILNSYNQRSEYVYRGSGVEIFKNRVNYASFKYVKITNLPGKPNARDIKGCFVTTDIAGAGSFSCSNKTLNSINDVMRHTLRCLMLGGYQVDCHSRERLGYGGDGHSSLETTLAMFRADAFYRKWTQDWIDAQSADGDMPHTAPCPYAAGGGPFWGGFLAAATWRNYLHYGDASLLKRNYPAIVKWLGFVESHTKGGLLREWSATPRRSWYLGDWAVPEGVDQKHPESIDLFCNCFVIYILEMAADIAEVAGREKDAVEFRRNAEKRRPVVHKTFFNNTVYADGDQIDLIMPLAADVTPCELKDAVFKRFTDELLVKNKGHLATGLSGTYMMIQYLQSIGRDDLVYEFASKTTEPSWGYMVKKGATATWEYWDDKHSRIHNCYNNIGSWFQQGLCGIRPDPEGPGFKRLVIKPAILKGLRFARARYESIRGPVECEWRRAGKRVEVDIKIPVGSVATVYLPVSSPDLVLESGRMLSGIKGVSSAGMDDGCVRLEIVSGKYRFAFPAR